MNQLQHYRKAIIKYLKNSLCPKEFGSEALVFIYWMEQKEKSQQDIKALISEIHLKFELKLTKIFGVLGSLSEWILN